MNKYYKKFIVSNKNFLDEIYEKLKEENIIENLLNDSFINKIIEIDLKNNYKIKISLRYSTGIIIYVDLKEHLLMTSYKANIFQKQRDSLINIREKTRERFNDLNTIRIYKKNTDGNVSSLYELTKDSATMSVFQVNKLKKNDEEDVYRISLNNDFEIMTNINNKNPERNIKNYLFLENINKIKSSMINFEEISDYIFIGKRLTEETKDHLSIMLDIDRKIIDDFDTVKTDLYSFSYEFDRLSYRVESKLNESMKFFEELFKNDTESDIITELKKQIDIIKLKNKI